MIKSRYKIFRHILRILTLVFAIFLGLFSFSLIPETLENPTPQLILRFAFYLTMSVTFIGVAVDGIKQIIINTSEKTITVIYLGVFKRVYKANEIRAYNDKMPGRFPNITIEVFDDYPIVFSAGEFKNFDELACGYYQSIYVRQKDREGVYQSNSSCIMYCMGFVFSNSFGTGNI